MFGTYGVPMYLMKVNEKSCRNVLGCGIVAVGYHEAST
jgi:hypothetical protein